MFSAFDKKGKEPITLYKSCFFDKKMLKVLKTLFLYGMISVVSYAHFEVNTNLNRHLDVTSM